jgi:CDP-diacylglycerol--glycerol-3-phosphate 3-phosphatidyltransferase
VSALPAALGYTTGMRFMRQIPNALTVVRLLSLPAFVVLYSRDAPQASWPAAILLFFAALSDVADGQIARRFHFESDFGRVLDPFVDRAFYVTVLASLLAFSVLPVWAVVPIFVRDAVMVVGGALLLGVRHEKPRVMMKGKLSNVILAAGIWFFVIDLRTTGWIIYGAGAALYLWVGALYVVRAWHERRAGGPVAP